MATLCSDTPVTPLRQRMLDDMAMRALRSRTQHDYVRHVRTFAAFLGRSPDTATAEDIRRFQLHQHESGASAPTINNTVSALRFLFGVTLDRPDLLRRLVLVRYPRRLPEVLSVEEVGRLLEAAPGIKYRAALGVAYGAGLRVSEVAHLKVNDIDSKRMLIRTEEGKGRKDRNAMLSPQLLDLLRLWWRAGKRSSVLLPHGWLRASPCPRHGSCARSRAAATPTRSRRGSCTAPCRKQPKPPGSASASARTRCATASPPTCWSRTSTSASSRCCWGTRSWTRPRSTRRSPRAQSMR